MTGPRKRRPTRVPGFAEKSREVQYTALHLPCALPPCRQHALAVQALGGLDVVQI